MAYSPRAGKIQTARSRTSIHETDQLRFYKSTGVNHVGSGTVITGVPIVHMLRIDYRLSVSAREAPNSLCCGKWSSDSGISPTYYDGGRHL